MPHVIKIENRDGVFYWPKDYGFSTHALAADIAQAEVFATEDAATRKLNHYRWPSLAAFWNDERAYAKRHEDKIRSWRFNVTKAAEKVA